ncbi:MAG: hypothetical protein KDB27_35610, partial [Planctomycetales bacterium]|nr:hypothetical protein [Planctomycetales bacterium]
KSVVTHLASRLHCPIVPVSVAVNHKLVLTRRWDRLEIPHLFSDVSFVIGRPLEFPSAKSRRRGAIELKQAIDAGELVARQALT